MNRTRKSSKVGSDEISAVIRNRTILICAIGIWANLFVIGCGGNGMKVLEKLDRDNGFRGIALGTSIESNLFKDGIRQNRSGGELSITRPEEKLEFEGVPLESIQWYFRGGTLSGICLITGGRDKTNSQNILAALIRIYGPGMPNSKVKAQTWEGKRVRLSYRDNQIVYGAHIWFRPVSKN